MTFSASAFNAAEKAAGDRRRAEQGPGAHVYSEVTKRWEWVAEQMESMNTRPQIVEP